MLRLVTDGRYAWTEIMLASELWQQAQNGLIAL